MEVEQSSPAPRKRRGCVWFVVLLCLLGVAGYGLHRRFPEFGVTPAKETPARGTMNRSVPVVVATARRGDLPIYLDAPGTVIALNTVTVRSRVDGQIVKVNYTEGQTVNEGDLLLQIDPRPFEVQLTQAKGQLAKDEASLKNAKLDLARYEAAGRGATQQQVDTAQAAVALSQGAIEVDHGQIDSANLQLTYCGITAPISGQIGLRLVDQGNIVHASDPAGLAVITQIEPITVVFSLAEDYLPQVMKASGDGVKLPVQVRNRDRTAQLAEGTLVAVDSQIDATTLTAKFKSVFDNKDHALFPNQAVNVRLLVDTRKDTVLIPAVGLQHSPQTPFVYVVKDDHTVDMRPITPGPVEGEDAAIEKGLDAGEIVVTAGVDKLEPGMKVKLPGEEAPAAEQGPAAEQKGAGNAEHKREGAPAGGPGAGHRRKAKTPDKPEGAPAPEAPKGSENP